ncbi:unnamed protein product [Polarella glacialis]|uniref:G-patch domain-containing protein n=1 Tax=Polarella glacialis TaxID=89957 RepID=A0A813HCU7_POLGL|nr:unnamed protein product [Polarella glacialis]
MFAAASAGTEDIGAEEAEDNDAVSRELAPLSTSELSSRYGMGFELLRRMGYSGSAAGGDSGIAGGMRADSLQAPLLALKNPGRRGIVAATEEDAAEEQLRSAAALHEPESLDDLVTRTLAAMREAGDDEEACEIQRMAAFCSMEAGFLSDLPRPRMPKKRRRPEAEQHWQEDLEEEKEALELVLRSLFDEHFPVDLEEQGKRLRWDRKWRPSLGTYDDFAERHEDDLRVVRCPAGFALVLPKRRPSSSNCGSWSCERYLTWCRQQRLGAKGKLKKKWKHLELTVERLCKGFQDSLWHTRDEHKEADEECTPLVAESADEQHRQKGAAASRDRQAAGRPRVFKRAKAAKGAQNQGAEWEEVQEELEKAPEQKEEEEAEEEEAVDLGWAIDIGSCETSALQS